MTESDNESTGTSSGATTTTMFKPTKPKFGGIKEVGPKTWAAWIGGTPKADWSGLEDDNPKEITPNQFRSTSISGQAKSQSYRVMGLTNKFGKDDDLQDFGRKVKEHFIEHGLDTTTYLMDPTKKKSVVSVLDNHALFNMKDGVEEANDWRTNEFDEYLLGADRDGKKFLLNSLDPYLETQLRAKVRDDDCFTAYWLRLIHIIKSVSVDRFEKIKDRIKSRKLSDYASEDIEQLATDYLKDFKELESAGMYDHNLTMKMLNTIMTAGGDSQEAEDFRYPLRDIKQKLNTQLLTIRHMDYHSATTSMNNVELDVQSVLEVAKDEYRKIHDEGKWPAASNAKDSKAMNKNYGNVNMAASQDLQRYVNSLVQNATKYDKSKDKCHNCGQRGHWSRDCPQKKTGRSNRNQRDPNRGKPNSRNKSARNNPGRATARTPPPKPGESEIKFIDGKKKYWCKECNRWTESHGTDSHKSKEELRAQSKNSVNTARVNFDLHPSVFHLKRPGTDLSAMDLFVELFSMPLIQLIVSIPLLYILWSTYHLFPTVHSSVDTYVLPVVSQATTLMTTGLSAFMSFTSMTYDFSSDIMTNLCAAIWRECVNNMTWTWLIVTLMSGIIGFGIGSRVYFQFEERPIRYRSGPNIRKQALRKIKPRQVSRLSRRIRHSKKSFSQATITELQSLEHHPKFSHIGRHKRYESPKIARIRQLRIDIDELRKEIELTESYLNSLKFRLRNKEYALKDLLREVNHTSDDFVNHSMLPNYSKRECRPLHKSNQVPLSNTKKPKYRLYNKSVQNKLKKNVENKVGTKVFTKDLNENAFKRTLKNMSFSGVRNTCRKAYACVVNLSNISSSGSMPSPDESVLFDSGANCCVTHRRDDFVGEFIELDGSQTIDGLGKTLAIKGQGYVAWTFKAETGTYRTLKLPCYYVPSVNTRIASIEKVLEAYPDETISITSKTLTLSGANGNPSIVIKLRRGLPLGLTNSDHTPVVHKADDAHIAASRQDSSIESVITPKPNIFKRMGMAISPQNSPEDPPKLHSMKNPPKELKYNTKRKRSLRVLFDEDHSESDRDQRDQDMDQLFVFRGRKSSDRDLPNVKQPALTNTSNINLTEPEKELLRWHHRLGHVSMKRVQWLFRQGVLATSEKARRLQSSAAKLTHGPLCTACQYAKQRRRTEPGTTKKVIKPMVDSLKKNDLFPGSEVSVDHFHCNPLGRLLHTYGKESPEAKFKGGCIFCDHATGFNHVELQTSLNSHHTLEAKKNYDKMCDEFGVIVQKYLSDNGTSFVNKDFEAHLEQFHQTIRHSSVGAHHSNGIAERNIGTITSIARAQLHHQALHWPDAANVELWPLAVLHAVYLLNCLPREDTGRSPLELFSRKVWASTKFHDLHVWGCPVYVLDSKLSNGAKKPRWTPRSSRGMYVGVSQKHGHTVPLVLDLETGKITAQYHVVFDDWFHTVEATNEEKIDFDHDDWYKTFGLAEYQYIPDHDPLPAVHPHSVIESEGATRLETLREVRHQEQSRGDSIQRETDPPVRPLPSFPQTTHSQATSSQDALPPTPPAKPPLSVPPPLRESSPSDVSPADSIQREKKKPDISPWKPVSSGWHDVEVATPQRTPESGPLTRSKTKRPATINYVSDDNMSHFAMQQYESWYDRLFVGTAAKKQKKDPDLYTWDEAMASPYKAQFLEAADDEIKALAAKGTWVEDHKSNATTKIIPGHWVFKIKRTSSGEWKRAKARYTIRGDLQEDDGEDNHSPVAAWPTVRAFMTIATFQGWYTTTIDFSNAFVQSPLPQGQEIWMHIPRGYKCTKGSEYCLKLVKSLYGLRAAPKLWVNHSTEAFKKLGLTQSKFDPCLWYGPDIMIVQYVDDCGIAAPTKERVDEFVNELKKLDFELTQESSFSEFLGIKFEHHKDGSIECTQSGLIQKTLKAAGMENCNPNAVPAIQVTLGTDEDGEPMDEPWNYRAICGMLLYLSTNTRPDLAFSVSQVCRFSSNPKKSHASAVKTILRYLKGTANKGLRIKPSLDMFNLDMYVDADFCGLFGNENPRSKNSVRSRTGYIISLCGWPLVWKSTLQTHLSQSTMEAEYLALSSSLKIFMPLRWLIEEMIKRTNCPQLHDARLHATVFEDNQSAFLLATNQRITSRTKYLLAKWHWFWDAYNRDEFSIVKCPTDKMSADYLTKPLPRATFEPNRERVQGW